MSIPNTPGKHMFKALIEPQRWMQYLKDQGAYPSCAIPAGAIVCYDQTLWSWTRSLPGRVDCDGSLKGSHLLPHRDRWILVIKAAGVGASIAVLTLEELIALGITEFVNLGTAGALQETIGIGDIVICDRAIRDEGTSYHYLPAARYAHASPNLTNRLSVAFEAKGLTAHRGASWTTDAPYRETIEELRGYRAEGVLSVEMEASALFAVGEYRGVSVSSIFAISDILSEADWVPGFHAPEVAEGLRRVFEIALETLATKIRTLQ